MDGSSVSRAWRDLAEPSSQIVDPADRRTARLLSRLLLLIAPLGLLSVVLQVLETGEFGTLQVAVSVAVIALLLTYGLSRTRHFGVAAVITTLIPTLGGVAVAVGHQMDPGWFAFMALNPALGTLLLSNRRAVWLAILNLGAVVAVVLLADDLAEGISVVAVAFNAIVTAVLLTAKQHRNNLEHDRNAALFARQRLNESILEATFGGIAQHDGGEIREANEVFRALFGLPESEAEGADLFGLFVPEARVDLESAIEDGGGRLLEVDAIGADGSTFTAEVLSAHVVDSESDAAPHVLAVRDVTERREAMDSLLRAQRMESVGRLAAGIAHDTNNQLAVISTNAELLMRDHGANDGAGDRARIIREATTQMGTLLRRVLAVGRERSADAVVIDLDSTISGLEPMWRQVVPGEIDMQIVRGRDVGPILMDPTDFEQVCLNLVLNASDSMDGSGELSIELGRLTVDESSDAAGQAPGVYQQILVSDTGEGIPFEHLERIFQPFFTTKDPSRGTGLGLYTARELVQEAGGSLTVTRHIGGSTFQLCIPEAHVEATA